MNQQRLRLCVKARQTGFSYIIGVETVLRCCCDGTDQLIVSASQRQASEVLDKCRRVNRLFSLFPARTHPPAVVTGESKTGLRFSNGARILSLPQNPGTIRGFTGNVYLDEYAHHRDDEAIYEAVAPAITRGHRLTVVSTPFGQSGRFYELWSDRRTYPEFSRFSIDVFQAKAMGLAIDIDALRQTFDEESFRQEFCCEFIDEATAFFPYELIHACTGAIPVFEDGERYMGVDVGRKKDRTCIVVLRPAGDVLYLTRLEELEAMTFEGQRRVVRGMIAEEEIRRCCMDATGLGMQLAEELNAEFGIVEPVVFSVDAKQQMVLAAKRRFENRTVRIPDDAKLIGDIHDIRKSVTDGHRLRFDALRSARGHADRFWALTLAIRAAESAPQGGVLFIGGE